jgi:lipid A 3-O-deacylase
MKYAAFGALAGTMALGCVATAAAGPVAEARFGVLAHNVGLLEQKNANKEASPNLSAELVFQSPAFLEWALAPRPYVNASLNTGGDTSLGSVGLEWNFALGESWAFQPGIGYALHNGEVRNPFPNGDPRAQAFVKDKVLLGSQDLFRVSMAVERKLSDKWGAQVLWEHYSHGQILGKGRNQGLDELGVRVTRKFGH